MQHNTDTDNGGEHEPTEEHQDSKRPKTDQGTSEEPILTEDATADYDVSSTLNYHKLIA